MAPGIGAFVGFVLGALIGNLFGHKKPRIPTASAQTILQLPYANYAVGSITSANGGNADMVKSEAQVAANTLNGLIAQVTGGLTPSFVANYSSPTQVYGHTGNQLWIKLGGISAAQINVDSGDQAVDKGVLWALPQTQIIGGDLFVKRAIAHTAADSVTSLAGDIQIASDYSFYTRNRDLIDGYITGAYATLSQAQMDYYGNNKALVDKVDTQGVASLTSSEQSIYSANQGTISAIVQALQNQSIANPWIITLQRANELGLMNWSSSDFYGGLGGFLQSFGLETALGGSGGAHAEDVTVKWDGTNLGLFTPAGLGAGTFSTLTQSTNASVDNDVLNPRFQDGRSAWFTATYNTPSFDIGVNFNADWSGSGTDSLWMHIGGSQSFALEDTRSGKMASTAGVTYEASVLAAQHRGLAQILIEFYDASDNYLGGAAFGGAREGGSYHGDPNNYNQIGGFATAPAGTAYRRINLRLQANGGQDPFGFFIDPISRAISPGQTTLSSWSSNGEGVTIDNFGSTMGYTPWVGYATGGDQLAVMRGSTSYQDLEAPSDRNVIFVGGDAGNTLTGGYGSSWLQGGAGNDTITTSGGFNTIISGGGNDNIQAQNGTSNYIASGTGIDYVYTGAGAATVVGGSGQGAQTILFAGSGSTTFIVTPGAAWDQVAGWSGGSATISFERYHHGVTADLMNHPTWLTSAWNNQNASYIGLGNGSLPNGNDYSIGIEDNYVNLRGSDYNDWLRTSELGGVLEGGGGADTLIGGGGRTAASYAHSASGVYVDLSTNTAYGGDADGDSFSNIQDLTGSNFSDELKGVAGSSLNGGAGDDWFDYSGSSNQYIGGDGFDTVDYSSAGTIDGTNGVSMTLNGNAGFWKANGDTYSSIEQIIGTAYNDYLTGTVDGTTFQGGAGVNQLYGLAGSDTYIVNQGDGVDYINDSNSNSNTLEFGDGIAFHDLWMGTVGGSSGYLQVGIRGTGTYAQVASDFGPYPVSSNNVIKNLSLNGSGSVDIGQITLGVGGDDNANTLTGLSNRYNMIFGYNGDDTIAADNYQWSNEGSFIVGGYGNDYIVTSTGDDQFGFDRGDGHDTIVDSGGEDSIIFGPTVAADDVIYEVVGNDLYIGILDLNNASLTASQVADNIDVAGGGVQYIDQNTGAVTFNTMEFVQAGGTSVDLRKLSIDWNVQYTGGGGGGPGGGGGYEIPPIVLDLTGDGLELTPVADSNIVTVDGNGIVTRLSWVGPTNGILAYDRNGDGKVNSISDISFIGDTSGAKTDLQGLASWDTNGDGVLDAKDAGWSKLVVWVDANQDGQSEAGEVKTLDQLGIASLNLKGTPTGFDGTDTIDSYVTDTTSFTWADGTSGDAYDVALARRFLNATGIENAADIGWGDLTADGQIGRLLNDPLSDAKGVLANAAKGLKSALSTALAAKGLSTDLTSVLTAARQGDARALSQLANVDLSGESGDIDAASAARWADVLDPVKRAARKALEAAGSAGDVADSVKTNVSSADWAAQLFGRGGTKSTNRLQVLALQAPGTSIDLVKPTESSVHLDVDADGTADHIGWVSANAALLAFDNNGNGVVDGAAELGFLGQQASGKTLIQTLASLDTNHDGVLDSQDASFGKFLLWRDANQDGISGKGETQTLAQAGIASIGIDPVSTNTDRKQHASNQVLGQLTATYTDGRTADLYDVALGIDTPTNTKTAADTPTSSVTPTGLASVGAASVGIAQATPASGDSLGSGAASPGGLSMGVAAVRGGQDGPEGASLAGDLVGADISSAEGWWSSISGGLGLTRLVSSDLGGVGSSNPLGAGEPILLRTASANDAATLQNQLLLRQSMAAFAGQSPGGSAALWAHAGSTDSLASLASTIAKQGAATATPTRTPLAAGA